MKQIQDIVNDIDTNLDIRPAEKITTRVLEHDDGENISDLVSDLDSEIDLKPEYKILIGKRKGKHFDALEKRSKLSKYLLPQTLRVKGVKHFTLLGSVIAASSKYSKQFWKMNRGVIFLGFFLFCISFAFITKVIVENRVNAGYQKLVDISAGNLGFSGVQKKVNNARFELLLADMLFSPFKIFPGEKINSVENVISGGRNLSRSLDTTLALGQNVNAFIEKKELSKIYFTQLFLNSYPELKKIQSSLEQAVKDYKNVSWLPSSELLTKKNNAVQTLDMFLSYITIINDNYPEFLNILGHEERKRYLIVFQNADEIRPTGGFMGSMGLLEVFRGRVQLFQKKDVYAIEWDLKKSDYERLPAPKGIDTLTDTFGLRDSNYYANLRDSSQAIKFFTDRAGIEIDGIVYINQNILLHLLEKTGPVYFEPLAREITSQNFSELMSLAVEAKSFKKGTLGTPKQVLFDFMEVFSEKLQDKGEYFDYLQSIVHDVQSRDIMMWSFDLEENKLLGELGVRGDIDYDTSLDFIYPVYTSLSGNKSDRYMSREYNSKVVRVEDSCSYNVKHSIKSTHNMKKNERERVSDFISEYNLSSPNLFEIQGAATNKQFVRVILPRDSLITPQEGMEIVNYGARRGIEFFLDTQLQETSLYDFSYTIENPNCEPYSVKYYKQPGIPSYSVDMNILGDDYLYGNLQEDFYFENRK